VGHLQKTTQLEVGELELEARFTDSKFNEQGHFAPRRHLVMLGDRFAFHD
jgi:hypothetical protein